ARRAEASSTSTSSRSQPVALGYSCMSCPPSVPLAPRTSTLPISAMFFYYVRCLHPTPPDPEGLRAGHRRQGRDFFDRRLWAWSTGGADAGASTALLQGKISVRNPRCSDSAPTNGVA